MDVYHKLLTAGCVVLFLAGCMIGVEYINSREAQARAEERSKAAQDTIAQLTKQQQGFSDQLKQLQDQHAKDLENVQRTFQQAQSPQQLASLIGQLMGLKQSPVVITPAATKDNPNPVATVELPDAPQVKTYFQQCEECKVNYANAQKELAIEKGTTGVVQEKLTVMTADRDQWKKTAQGGSRLQRVVKRAEHFLVDAGITALVLCGSGHCR